MLKIKVDILRLLKEAGLSTYRLRKDKILGESTIQKLRLGDIPSLECLNWLCETLGKQPADIIEYKECAPEE